MQGFYRLATQRKYLRKFNLRVRLTRALVEEITQSLFAFLQFIEKAEAREKERVKKEEREVRSFFMQFNVLTFYFTNIVFLVSSAKTTRECF